MLQSAGHDLLGVPTRGGSGRPPPGMIFRGWRPAGRASQQRPVDGRAYQAIFSDQIRNELGIPTMAVGGIVSYGDINTIVAAGRADMCALGRGYREAPSSPRHAARAQSYTGLKWPSQYRRAGE